MALEELVELVELVLEELLLAGVVVAAVAEGEEAPLLVVVEVAEAAVVEVKAEAMP